MQNTLTRRNLVKGAAMGAAATAIAAGTQLASADEAAASFEATVAWDAEYDVIVAGYGAGGAVAAITAAENGAKVLLMEKAPKPFAGGNSRFGQNFMGFTNRENAITFYQNNRGPLTKVQGDDVIEFLVDGFMTFYDWLIAHGATDDMLNYAYRPEVIESWPTEDPEADGFRKITIRPDMRYNPQDVNAALEFLRGIVKSMSDSIDVWYGAPAESLVQDPQTKVIHGVRTTIDDTAYTVRAKNGVVLSLGGFENNAEMIQNFTAYPELLAKGCSFNTGDGVVMAQEVGAQLWHMDMLAAPDPNFLNPWTGCSYGWTAASGDKTPPNAWYGSMGTTSCIIVGGDGTRFMNEAANETRNSRHGQTYFHGTWTHMPWPENSWMVFDEQARLDGHKPYNSWSEGLEQEIADGWITTGATLEELGEKIGIDATALASSIERFNGWCAAGLDEDCARQPETLVAFSGEGPYYAVYLQPAVTNTDGGAKRNVRCEIVNPREEPIGHLYSTGSFGSFWVNYYNGGGNMGENYVTGCEAGKNAAAIKDDATQDALVAEPVNFADTYERTQFDCAEGQYIGRHVGMNGDLAVRITLEGETITNVEVMEHNETPNLGSVAVEVMPQRIVEADTTLVDVVAGATRTSAAIVLAVEAALREAGIEPDVAEAEIATVK